MRKFNHPDEVTGSNASKELSFEPRFLKEKRLLYTAVQHQSEMDLVSHFPTVRYPDIIKETMQYSTTSTFLLTFYWNKEKYISRQVFIRKIVKSTLAKLMFIKTHLKIYQEPYPLICLYIISEKKNFLPPVFRHRISTFSSI